MEAAQFKTPYEKYLLDGIEEEKRNLDRLYDEFARTGPLNKQLLKRKIDETLQNIELLNKELSKYGKGLSWLREPSKERDEKAVHLEKVQEEPQPASPTPQAPKPTAGSRPAVGTPIGSPRPSVGTPVGKSSIGTTDSKPMVGTPAKGPNVGTPAQTPITQPTPSNSPNANSTTTPTQTKPSGRPRIGKPLTEQKS